MPKYQPEPVGTTTGPAVALKAACVGEETPAVGTGTETGAAAVALYAGGAEGEAAVLLKAGAG